MGFKSGRGNVTDLDVSGTFKANAGPDGIHQVTGSLHITGSEGANLIIQSRGEVSLRLEADTNNTDDSQNPFIEFIQDGGLTDYTIGLTQLSKNPEGVTVRHIGDNSLAIGANFVDDAIASAATGHVQFYNRLTASFSLIDKGSTNFGDIDRQGFRVGVGPAFSEANFPKGRMEIFNTSLSPCPALYLAVSGTSQPALVVDTKNTSETIVKVEGAALTTGDVMHLQSNSSDTSVRSILKITNDNTAATHATGLRIIQDSVAPAMDIGGAVVGKRPLTQDNDASGATITTAQFIDGIFVAKNRSNSETDTTPTAAQIVAAIPNCTVGATFMFTHINNGGNTITLTGGTDVTNANGVAVTGGNVFTLTAGQARTFVVRIEAVAGGSESVALIPLNAAHTVLT